VVQHPAKQVMLACVLHTAERRNGAQATHDSRRRKEQRGTSGHESIKGTPAAQGISCGCVPDMTTTLTVTWLFQMVTNAFKALRLKQRIAQEENKAGKFQSQYELIKKAIGGANIDEVVERITSQVSGSTPRASDAATNGW